jgi:hypothetical protein
MNKYANLHGSSGIDEYLITDTSIKVKFIHITDIYVYSNSRPGKGHVDEMKRLAKAGRGLATYISQNIRKDFDHKE